MTAIRVSITSLKRMPMLERFIVPGLQEWIIDFNSSGYVALHELNEITDELVILAVKHQREDDYA